MKVHLKTVPRDSDPLKAGTDIIADCGVVVARAKLIFSFQLEYEQCASLNSITTCHTCYAIRKPSGTMYGLVNGQEAMTAEVGASE